MISYFKMKLETKAVKLNIFLRGLVLFSLLPILLNIQM